MEATLAVVRTKAADDYALVKPIHFDVELTIIDGEDLISLPKDADSDGFMYHDSVTVRRNTDNGKLSIKVTLADDFSEDARWFDQLVGIQVKHLYQLLVGQIIQDVMAETESSDPHEVRFNLPYPSVDRMSDMLRRHSVGLPE